jgi:hypothetical protein
MEVEMSIFGKLDFFEVLTYFLIKVVDIEHKNQLYLGALPRLRWL